MTSINAQTKHGDGSRETDVHVRWSEKLRYCRCHTCQMPTFFSPSVKSVRAIAKLPSHIFRPLANDQCRAVGTSDPCWPGHSRGHELHLHPAHEVPCLATRGVPWGSGGAGEGAAFRMGARGAGNFKWVHAQVRNAWSAGRVVWCVI